MNCIHSVTMSVFEGKGFMGKDAKADLAKFLLTVTD